MEVIELLKKYKKKIFRPKHKLKKKLAFIQKQNKSDIRPFLSIIDPCYHFQLEYLDASKQKGHLCSQLLYYDYPACFGELY